MNKGFFAESIQKKALFSAMLQYNLKPAENSQPASSETSLQEFVDASFLSDASFQKYCRQPAETFWDFADETKRLALMDSPALQKLALLLGTAAHAGEISRIIDRQTVLALRADLGLSLYFYAIKRGNFQLPFLKTFFAGKDTELSLTEKVHKHGIQTLACCTLSWQKELKARFCQNHEQSLPDLPRYIGEQQELPPEQARLLWFSVKKILIQEVDGTWQNYFN